MSEVEDRLRELAQNSLEYAEDLRAEWAWKCNEPRAKNAEQYAQLLEHIKDLRSALGLEEDK